MTSEEHEDRQQAEEDQIEDLELDKDAVDTIRGAGKAKTADKAYTSMDGYIRQ